MTNPHIATQDEMDLWKFVEGKVRLFSLLCVDTHSTCELTGYIGDKRIHIRGIGPNACLLEAKKLIV